jgi:hypothetical protein
VRLWSGCEKALKAFGLQCILEDYKRQLNGLPEVESFGTIDTENVFRTERLI